jgi:hypothetical protein
MTSAVGEGVEGILPDISTIREAQRFLAKYFAVTRLVAAPYLSGRVGKRV